MRMVQSSKRELRQRPEFLTQPLAATGVAPVDQPRQKLFVCVPALEVPASAQHQFLVDRRLESIVTLLDVAVLIRLAGLGVRRP